MDPDPGGPKAYGSATLVPCHGTKYDRIRNLIDIAISICTGVV
jgi:hypothetical protein